MKKHLLFFCILPALYCSAQTSLAKAGSTMIEVYDASGRPLTSKGKEIMGSPWLNDNWGNGWLKFVNGRELKDVSLRFNQYNEQMYYKLEDIEFAFVDAVKEFSFSYDENGKTQSVLFRNGYPGTRPGSQLLFYQVLADSHRFQLLKRSYKSIQEYFDYTSAASKIFRKNTDLYVYDRQLQSLILVKNAQTLAASVPELAEALNPAGSKQRGKLATEQELVSIFAKMNP